MPGTVRMVVRSIVLVVAGAGLGCTRTGGRTAELEWRHYGGTAGFTRYSAADLITPGNVSGLKILWRRPAVDTGLKVGYGVGDGWSYFRSTPIMVGGVLYAPNGVGLVEAFDAGTGLTKWVQQPFDSSALEASGGFGSRGVAYWQGNGEPDRIFSLRGFHLIALDAGTGKYIAGFGQGGRVTLDRAQGGRSAGGSGPTVVGDVVVIGGSGGAGRAGDGGDQMKSVPESVLAYDARTGRKLWEFSPMPSPEDSLRATWGAGSAELAGAMGSYGMLSADEELGYVYVPFSAPNPPSWGGWRPGDNAYSCTLVALDVKTGRRVWHYQMVRHDLWDYDLSAPPILGDITVDGRRIKAVMQTGKNALLFTLDRATGQPVWPIVERPVPPSTVAGEHASATQPIPTKPPPLDRQGISPDDLIDFTPELKRQALEITKRYRFGPMYSPPSLYDPAPEGNKGTLVVPGTDGGGNWNSGAFDPETGTYYTIMVSVVSTYSLVKPSQSGATVEWMMRQDAPEVWNLDGPQGLPLLKPPYGRLVAVDMNQGELKWVVANGDGPRDHPLLKPLNLPPLGIPGRAAVVVTKQLIFVGESSDAVYLGKETHGFGNKFRAYGKVDGRVLAEVTLPVGTTGAPIAYVVNGKQYVVVAVGGSGHGSEWIALGL